MSLLQISENSDPNYLATVVKLPEIKAHPNADRLCVVEVFGNTIVIAKDTYTEGEKVVYFPVESCIKKEFLSWANLLTKAELNADEKTKGYFESKGRVKAVALRGIPSQGFLFKTSKLAEYYKVDENLFKVGDTFDVVGSDPLVSKYVKGSAKETNVTVKKSRVPKWLNFTIGLLPRPIRRVAYLTVNYFFDGKSDSITSRIMPGYFQFHYKTEHLGKNIFLLNPDDEITITSKLHGTSAIFGKLLTKKAFNPFRYIGNLLGMNISEHEYKLIYSSRSVVKNRKDGKYTDDVWGLHAKELENIVPEGYVLYGEIVGHNPTGKAIQKNYDYKSAPNTSDFFVYRISVPFGSEGKKDELSFGEIVDFCNEYGLHHVPLYYTGAAEDLFDIPKDDKWNEKFLSALKDEYLDKKCELCNNDVIREGVVLKFDSRVNKPVFKFKSPLFVIGESAARDAGEDDMEEDS